MNAETSHCLYEATVLVLENVDTHPSSLRPWPLFLANPSAVYNTPEGDQYQPYADQSVSPLRLAKERMNLVLVYHCKQKFQI